MSSSLAEHCVLVSGRHIPVKQYNTESRGIGYLTGPSDFGELSPTVSKWTEFPQSVASKGDILITVKGSGVGKINLLLDDQVAISRQLMAIRPRDINARFLYLFLSSKFAHFQSLANGAAIPGISRSDVLSLKLPSYSKAQQERIATVLDEAFAAIGRAKSNTEKNLKNARDLIGASFAAYTCNSEHESWVTEPVASLAMPQKGAIRTGPFGSQLLHSEFVDDGIAVLGIDNAVTNAFQWAKRRFITEEKFRQLERFRVRPGDVLITIMGTCGRCAIVPDDIPTAINTKHLCCITLDRQKCQPGYLHAFFLFHPTAQEYLKRRAKGAIMAGLNMGIIKEMPVLLPPLEKQCEIVRCLDSLRSEAQRLECIYTKKVAALDELKQSLLEKAFTGQLTSKAVEQELAKA